MGLTILGGYGFVGSQYVRDYYDQAIGNIVNVNDKYDYDVHSKDVLYFISTVHNYNVFDDPFRDINTNLITLVRVLENWRRFQGIFGIKDGVFNFISSWFVYGKYDCLDVTEGAQCDPKGFYSITKRCAEQLLISYCEAYGLNYRILRLANVVGPGDKKVSAKKNALQYMINQLKAGEDIEIYGDGKFYRDYIHVEDCSRAIELVLSRGELNSVYNIGNGKTWMFIEILDYVAEQLKSQSKHKLIEPKEFHKQVQVKSFYMNTEKLKSLGYHPKYTGEDLYKAIIA